MGAAKETFVLARSSELEIVAPAARFVEDAATFVEKTSATRAFVLVVAVKEVRSVGEFAGACTEGLQPSINRTAINAAWLASVTRTVVRTRAGFVEGTSEGMNGFESFIGSFSAFLGCWLSTPNANRVSTSETPLALLSLS
jgi:hypothetical protein